MHPQNAMRSRNGPKKRIALFQSTFFNNQRECARPSKDAQKNCH
jgi:hypothetical protein